MTRRVDMDIPAVPGFCIVQCSWGGGGEEKEEEKKKRTRRKGFGKRGGRAGGGGGGRCHDLKNQKGFGSEISSCQMKGTVNYDYAVITATQGPLC